MAENDDLFGNLDSKMGFLEDQKTTSVGDDGLYRVDLTKAKDKKWRSVIRFLPNLTKDGKVGQSAIEKISHYVNIKSAKELSGFFDSPRNFNEKCPLTDLYYNLTNSKNAILVEKAKSLQYSKKYYSYVLVLEDPRPELVGKIMIFQYGKTIKDKIAAERTGEVSSPCNVFDLSAGKDFVLLVNEIQTGDETYPDYKKSQFKPETTPLQLYKNGEFRSVPLVDGKIDPNVQGKVREFLLSRGHDLEEFGPKKLTEQDHAKINDIIAFLTGKVSAPAQSTPSSNDFSFDDDLSSMSGSSKPAATTTSTEDDFFS